MTALFDLLFSSFILVLPNVVDIPGILIIFDKV